MKLSLVVLTPGANQGKVLEIKLSQFVVGRDPQCHLRPASPMISKRHCALLQREGKSFVRDFGSTNGTFVNNEQIKGEMEVHNGDQLKIGPLMFTVLIEASTPVNRPTPPPPTKGATQTVPAPKTATPPPATTNKPAANDQAAIPNPNEATVLGMVASDDSSNDDDIAAMLLSLHDDASGGTTSSSSDVPEGSTVHEMPLPTEEAAKAEKEKAKPTASANTSAAAKSILEKYMRRPRG